MSEVYVIDYAREVEEYDGRTHVEATREEDIWFPSEDSAREYLREKGWRTKEQEEEFLLAQRVVAYEKELRTWRKDDQGYRAALAAGVSPRLITKPHQPEKPTRAYAESWYEIVKLERHHADTRRREVSTKEEKR